MKPVIRNFPLAAWLFAAVLLLSGSLRAAEPAWITVAGPRCPLVRKEFTIPARPSKAVVRIVGLGHFELRVNGRRVGDAVIRQPWSQYNKTIYFEELDVTRAVAQGEQCPGRDAWQLLLGQPARAPGQIP